MSRTVHHVRYDHWNIKEPDYCWVPLWRLAEGREFHLHHKRGGRDWVLVEQEQTVGNVLWDLRFYAGCKRVPAKLVHRTPCWAGWPYSWGHAGTSAIGGWANQIEGGLRADARDYAREAVKVHRAGGEVEELPEPDGRTRHSALWEAW